jgi:hypothetical protein
MSLHALFKFGLIPNQPDINTKTSTHIAVIPWMQKDEKVHRGRLNTEFASGMPNV